MLFIYVTEGAEFMQKFASLHCTHRRQKVGINSYTRYHCDYRY